MKTNRTKKSNRGIVDPVSLGGDGRVGGADNRGRNPDLDWRKAAMPEGPH